MTQPRKPKGTSSGGQFDEKHHSEAEGELVEVVMETDAYGNPYEPGDFPRTASGAVRISSPDPNQVVKSGANAGKRRFFMYGGDAKSGTPTSSDNLVAWKKRSITRGVAMQPELLEELEAALDEAEPSEHKAIMNDWVEKAHEVAESYSGAERGRFVSSVLADLDRDGKTPGSDQILTGASIGVSKGATERLVRDWSTFLEDKGIEVHAVDVPVVNDTHKKAGQMDRIVTLSEPVTITVADGEVTVPAGTPIAATVTTKKMHLDDDGNPRFVGRDAARLATQVDGVPYDIPSAERGTWEASTGAAPSRDVGLIIHCDMEKAASGFGGSFTAYAVDLSAGRRYVEASTAHKAAESAAQYKSIDVSIDPPTAESSAA